MNLMFLEETRETSLQSKRRKQLALISILLYENCSRYRGSLFISVNNRKDAGAHHKGK